MASERRRPSATRRALPAGKTATFIAIDFETANYDQDSACALAVIRVVNGKIARQTYHLIRPPSREFVFTHVHGITWRKVKNKPTFGQLWPEIRDEFTDVDFVAAHNALFDSGVLKACCRAAKSTPPRVRYLCTVELARRVWNIYPTKLPDVCRRLRIPLNHHEASSDAIACAKIVLAAMRKKAPCIAVPQPQRFS